LREPESEKEASSDTGAGEFHHEPQDAAALCSERHANADLVAAP